LRDRREDVDKLALEFLRRFNKEHGVALTLSKRAMDALRGCDFPGNVRELESCVKRTAALAKNSVIVVEDLACSNGNCLSLVLGKSMSKMQSPDAHYIPLPVVSPQENTLPVRRGEIPPRFAPASVENSELVDSTHCEDPTERQRLVEAMERTGWVQAKAARYLRLTPRQMGYALRKHNIEIKRF
jgi:Nif-specific regulatory protein